LKPFLKGFAVAAVLIMSLQVHAGNKETPPMEPPYTNDTEFDQILGEDPGASSQIPLSPAPSQPSQSTPRAATAAPAKSKESGYEPSYQLNAVDKTPHKGVKLIHHPDAKKGLIRIEQDGTYVYKVKTTKKDQTGIVRFGVISPPNIQSADGQSDFKSMYTSSDVPILMFDYEWQPFSKYGKLGVQAGAGVATATGQGHFLKNGTEAPEKYTFLIAPLNLGLIYRLEYFKRQWIAPYVAGGGTYIAVAEMRDDGKKNFTGTPAVYAAGGMMFNITAIDKNMAFNLDNEYGVGNLWLVAEYRLQTSFSKDLDFTGSIMSLGISADF
jgi:hypothetical protein